MKAYKITSIALLAVTLFAACGKDEGGKQRLRILSERLQPLDTKVVMDTNLDNFNGSGSWKHGEMIDINGKAYPIAYDDNGHYVDMGGDPIPATIYAIYPATCNDDDDITVVNNGNGLSTISINHLTVNFANGGQETYFPMATDGVNSATGTLIFKHTTACLAIKLVDTADWTGGNYNIAALRITVRDINNAGDNYTIHRVHTYWGLTPPVMPSGEVGESEENQQVSHTTTMLFTIKDGGQVGKLMNFPDKLNLFVPLLPGTINSISVTAYDPDGRQIFNRHKEGFSVNVQANRIFTLPDIEF